MEIELKAGQFTDPPLAGKEEGRMVIVRPLEGRMGFAFALCDAQGRSAMDAERLRTIIEEHIERLADSFGEDAHAQHRFEQFLASLNETIALTVKNSEWSLPIGSFLAVVGIAEGETMYLSGNGDVTAMFLHRTPQQRYQVFNLSRSIRTEQALPTWEKAFAVVLDGELHEGDVLCVANRDLQPTIDTDELCSILSTLPPTGAAAKIRQYFPPKGGVSVFVVCATSVGSTFETAKPSSERSLTNLHDKRDETTRLLEDQSPRPGNAFTIIGNWLRSRKPKVAGAERPTMPALLRRAARISGLFLATKTRIASITRHGKSVLPKGIDKETRYAISEGVKVRADRAATKAFGSLRKLPPSSKYLLVAAGGVVFALILSISFLSRSHATAELDATYAAQIDQIRDLREQAAAAVIYQDESRARALYQQASALTEVLPADTEERGQSANELKVSIAQSLDELRRAVNIPDPPLVTDLAVLGVTDARTLISKDGLLYVLSADKHVFRIDPAAKKAEPIIAAIGEVGSAREAALDADRILFLDDRPGLSRFDFKDNGLHVSDLLPAAGTSWNDLTIYADKLYLLETNGTDGQIQRFARAGSGWSAPSPWIRSKAVTLEKARSFAIDATVFILTGSDVVRFSSGGQMGWKPSVVDPPLSSGTDIWTDVSSTWLYVLEPAQKRLLIYTKESGTFTSQIVSPTFENALDVIIDEATKTAYILSGTKLYAVRLSHL